VGGFQGFRNHRNNAIQISQHFVIPEAREAITLRLQPRSPRPILRSLHCMLATIDFDDKPCLMADEIHNIAADRRLLAKMRFCLIEAT
jgi:hypothetical protein